MSSMPIFKLAEEAGVKKEMLDTLKSVMAEHSGESNKKFGPEELFFAIQMGMADANVPDNFEYRSWFTLARAYMYGFLMGKSIVREMEGKSNVETKS
jgi:hypothetical protein